MSKTGEEPDDVAVRVSVTSESGSGRTVELHVSRAAVAEAVGRRGRTRAPRARRSVGQAWLATAFALREGDAAGLFQRSALAAAHFEQVLIHGLLDSQPEALVDKADALPDTVRRAVGFCADHAGDPITTTDIAHAARTSVRSLQRMFRTYLGMSPLEYLQRVRLRRAHHDLQAIAAGHAEGTVADVATRWGFAHFGRFAAQYRRTYGHSPVQTLRAAPSNTAPRDDSLCTAAPLCR
ncbi:AraC family transcriptional regulator [Kibdelosporangium persicum]|uniref:Helix-turn-helix domain-containing protein n=1 Tax=Kibdelosporangium persicum TaxID=2698649 RepID=A0ABX2F947_9PSEU|nr:AraC family transcriptional regulator [Kibdelosporangium persicum]NRN67649.1 Helix-turn-helix domain-containing protein [Kibdelosporangium persicum]